MISPAGVGVTLWKRSGRTTSFSPTIRSSAATCWLIADWV